MDLSSRIDYSDLLFLIANEKFISNLRPIIDVLLGKIHSVDSFNFLSKKVDVKQFLNTYRRRLTHLVNINCPFEGLEETIAELSELSPNNEINMLTFSSGEYRFCFLIKNPGDSESRLIVGAFCWSQT